MRRLIALLGLLVAGLEHEAGYPLLLGALAHHHGEEHAHSVGVVAEAGHRDLVLSHPHDHHPDEASDGPSLAPAHATGDHVVHISNSDPSNASWRRADLATPAAAAIRIALPFAPDARAFERASSPRRARSPDHLRTVVLLI